MGNILSSPYILKSYGTYLFLWNYHSFETTIKVAIEPTQPRSFSLTKLKFINYQWCLVYFNPVLGNRIKLKDRINIIFLFLVIAKLNYSFRGIIELPSYVQNSPSYSKIESHEKMFLLFWNLTTQMKYSRQPTSAIH